MQARQILIDRRSYGEIDTLRGLTEAELVAKAKLTLELVEKDGVGTVFLLGLYFFIIAFSLAAQDLEPTTPS